VIASPSISVVLPAFNESGALEQVVRGVDQALAAAGHDGEIIIVNDGSTDHTPTIADRLQRTLRTVRVIHHGHNVGYGAAQRSGIQAAVGAFVCVLPADGQVPPEELLKYLAAAERADVIVGTYRNRPDGIRRRLLSWIYRLVLRALFDLRLRNVNAPKLFRREHLMGVDVSAHGGFADAQIMIQLRRQGRRFHEIDVRCLPRATGRSSIGMAAAFESIQELWAFYRKGTQRP
jgi:dolichol-phosphate mannosyltransferase